MFTGLVEEVGEIIGVQKGAEAATLTIKAKKVLEHTKIGDSIALNGVCLTVTQCGTDHYSVDVMNETFDKTTLSHLTKGTRVNLERAMPADGRFGGHLVSGHIDGRGRIEALKKDGNAIWYDICVPDEMLPYLVKKGSIAIDGISLTIADVSKHSFSVSTIPHTRAQTTLQDRKAGDYVNLECDMIGKYVWQMLAYWQDKPEKKTETITTSFLAEHGFL